MKNFNFLFSATTIQTGWSCGEYTREKFPTLPQRGLPYLEGEPQHESPAESWCFPGLESSWYSNKPLIEKGDSNGALCLCSWDIKLLQAPSFSFAGKNRWEVIHNIFGAVSTPKKEHGGNAISSLQNWNYTDHSKYGRR